MSTCGSLRQFFDKPPLPENPPSLFDSLSAWNQTKSVKPDESSFTEIFGELHLHDKAEVPPPSDTSPTLCNKPPLDPPPGGLKTKHSAESLQLCTEGLGFESLGNVEDLMKDAAGEDWDGNSNGGGERLSPGIYSDVRRRMGNCGEGFPPPISTIGRNGKPWVHFKSYRNDGRFVLREIRVPTQEFLHASREDGRLKLQFVHEDEDISEENEGADEQEHDEERHVDDG